MISFRALPESPPPDVESEDLLQPVTRARPATIRDARRFFMQFSWVEYSWMKFAVAPAALPTYSERPCWTTRAIVAHRSTCRRLRAAAGRGQGRCLARR